MQSNSDFSELVGIGDLVKKMIEKNKHIVYPLAYSLVKLFLIVPIATVTIERVLSGMNLINTSLSNRMGEEFMNDCLVLKEVFLKVLILKKLCYAFKILKIEEECYNQSIRFAFLMFKY